MADQVTVRMYNVGFGDAFLLTVRRSDTTWRMLVDCGVHRQGQVRPLREVVEQIITDLSEAADGVPRLDVVLATHRHADHIHGFARPEWEQVHVGEVWLSFVEDDEDPDARGLRASHDATARALLALVEERTQRLPAGGWPWEVSAARDFAMNSLTNADAMDRLLGRNGAGFAGPHRVRFFPEREASESRVAVGPDVTVHILGPPRDPAMLRRMHPPSSVGWFRLDESDGPRGAIERLFAEDYGTSTDDVPAALIAARKTLALGQVNNDAGLLRASALLERVLNNTSLFFVLDVAGTRLLFPGDAQHGAWEHVLENPEHLALVRDCAFYKIGHHGSHNATPRRFVEEVWDGGGYAMLPWGLVKRWQESIPKRELMDALEERSHTVIRIDEQPADPQVTFHEDVWSELTLPV
jgi:beta-lactamase superfamily II metal-dependent hydrolase